MHQLTRRPRGIVLLLAFTVLLVLTASAGASAPQVNVQRINVAYDDGLANGEGQGGLAVSADGRYVAFASSASNIVEGDDNGRYDIFLRDTVSQETTLVSVTMDGGFATNGTPNYVDMTPDGRYVLFVSTDANLVANDTNGYIDLFLRDMASQETTRVNISADGTQGNFYLTGDGSISDDGRYVAFSTLASNMIPGDTNGRQDSFVKDMQTGAVAHVSYADGGGQSNGDSFYAVMSGDGTKVAFLSYATNLVPEDASDEANLFVRDVGTGDIERVDATTSGGESATGVDFAYCDLDYTGRRIVFASRQTDIIDVPAGTLSQVYLRDTESDETTVVARTVDDNPANAQCYNPSISSDGRWVSFVGGASNLVADDTNGVYDVFLRDMQTDSMERLNYNENGEQLNGGTYEQRLCADATAVVFNSRATNIIEPYASGSQGEIYLSEFRDINTPPVAVANSYTTDEDTALVVGAPGVLGNDTDADGDSLEATVVAGPAHGTLDLGADGSFTYEPDDDYNGPDSFTYKASEGIADSNVAAVTITVTPVDEAFEAVPIAGTDRYRTAVEASQETYPDGALTVVIATGVNWPDALGGAALAGAVEGPLLLTTQGELPSVVVSEITRLKAKNAYILGGTSAVSQAVQDALGAKLSGTVTRIAGSNRYATANQVADAVIRIEGADYSGDAFIATGANFPDALGASPLAASSATPILLAERDATPYLPSKVDSAVILGGQTAVTSVTEAAVRGVLGTANVTRVGGTDRFDTAAKVADYGVAHGMHWDGVGVATGLEFPDALSGGAMLGRMDSVLLLTERTSLVPAAAQRISANKNDIDTVYFIGGTSAVSTSVRDQVIRLLEP